MKPVDPAQITTVLNGVTTRRVGVSLGAEISGIDLTKPIAQDAFEALSASLVEHEMLILRDQNISSADLLRIGAQFGELSVHPFAPNEGDTPELIKFRNDANTAPFGTDVWHSDETFREQPPTATILCAKEVPAIGGDTMFASMTAAYEGLSDRMQRLISGLEAIHDIKPFKALFGPSDDDKTTLRRYEDMFPPRAHPVVRIHPVSGRKAIFVNPQFTVAIKDMDERESRALLDILFQQALIPEYQYRLRWLPHTIAIWDNRSTQHYAVHDYYPQKRYMERVTVRGGPVVGIHPAATGDLQRKKFSIAQGVDPYGGHKAQ